MTNVNKTLYIPLYGKSFVSKKGIILHDETAEKIWADAAISLKGKSRSKWLAYNMAMRARVFDDWTDEMLMQNPNAIVLHIGCGLARRVVMLALPEMHCQHSPEFGDVQPRLLELFPDIPQIRNFIFSHWFLQFLLCECGG